MPRRREILCAGAFAAAWPALALAQPAATVRLRGTLEAVSPTQLTLRQRSGERIVLAIAPGLAGARRRSVRHRAGNGRPSHRHPRQRRPQWLRTALLK